MPGNWPVPFGKGPSEKDPRHGHLVGGLLHSEGGPPQQCGGPTRRFRIRWRRKRGTNKWYVYTFIADRPLRSLKAKIRALTHRTSQHPPRDVLIRLNQIMRGWANYFKHAVAKHTFSKLEYFVWWRVVRWLRALHRWRWKDVRRWLADPLGGWRR
ncbi:group II intron maturase-specific domain-containing protein, partial [Streptomyces sp. NPDC006668]|uniref:group II intron maturase-specific domain-containing protein n=1 Tax=Streptomyces sp. NPDC006668 TaxID=3156903 RepID=UPI00340B1154